VDVVAVVVAGAAVVEVVVAEGECSLTFLVFHC
jgi:hypothetical protein